MLHATVVRHKGRFRLDVDLALAERATLVLVGESGAGKTTLLRLLAGLERPDEGRIALDGAVWSEASAGASAGAFAGASATTSMPPWSRPVGYVPQDATLFPHLTVRENVAFGLRASGLADAAVRARVDAALERFGLATLAARRPRALSGGQQQRVALARAALLEPRLLLLDEPLSALDLQTRRAVRAEIRALLADLRCITVYVTHSPMEAMVFGEQIAVLEAGRITQLGGRDELLQRPRSPYVADFLGVNLFRGTIASRDGAGSVEVVTDEGAVVARDPDAGGERVAGEVFVAVSPRDVMLSLAPPPDGARSVFRGVVAELAPEPPQGERVRVSLESRPRLVAELGREQAAALGLAAGVPVFASFDAASATAYR